MKNLYPKFLVIVFLAPIFCAGQNISVNTTGAANSTSSMFEVIQPATAASSSVGIFSRHLGTAANAYAIWAEATGATNKYAIVVPAGGGSVGIGTTTPGWPLDIVNNQNFYTLIGVRNNDPGALASSGMIMYNDVGGNYAGLGVTSSGFTAIPIIGPNKAFWDANSTMDALIINMEGPDPIQFATSSIERMRVDGNGNVGIGATSPGELLEVYAADPTIRIRNQNDQGGGFIGNTWLALQFGMYNPGPGAWGAMADGEKKSFFGMDYTGKVGSLTNSWWTPAFRNVLDDGTGWAGIGTSTPQGLLDVRGGNTGLDALFVKTDGGANPWQGGIVHHQGSTYAFKQTVQNTSSATLATMQFDYVSRTSPTTVTTADILVLQANGSVGIGNNVPPANTKLSIKDGHLQVAQTTAPTVAAVNCNCAPTLTAATDIAGRVNFTPGASATAGAQVTVTFNKTFVTAPVVTLTPYNSNAATAVGGNAAGISKGVYVTSTTTGFTINYNIDPNTAPDMNGLSNQYTYHVIETQ